MQKTAEFQFKLIDPEDSFLPGPLNDNAQAVEDALKGLAARIEGACAVGSFTGNGASAREVELGVTPRFALVITQGMLNGSNYVYAFLAFQGAGCSFGVGAGNSFATTGTRLEGSVFRLDSALYNGSGKPCWYLAVQ